MLLLWPTNPDALHPAEEDVDHVCDAGYAPASSRCGDVAAAASIVLRRQMIFRDVTDIRVWTNPGSISWSGTAAPTTATVYDAVLDPLFGMLGSVEAPCTCHLAGSGANRCWAIELDFVANPNGYVNLRRGRPGWSDRLEQSRDDARERRAAELRPVSTPS